MALNIFLNFLLSVCIGAIMGLEREIVHQRKGVQDFAGIRTFILISIFAFVLTYISITIFHSVAAFIVGFIGFLILILLAYYALATRNGRVGATTEIAAIITFLLSVLVTLDLSSDLRLAAILITIIVASLLALKERLHRFAKNIKPSEVYATIKMALISIIILPFLPNKAYTLLDIPYINNLIVAMPKVALVVQQLDIFNPFKIWLSVVFITGLSFIGYILIKTVGVNKGIGLTSLLGGLFSSTAVTVALSDKGKGKKNYMPYVSGIILASSVMFLRVLILVSAVNPSLLGSIIFPLGAMALSGFLIFFIITNMGKNNRAEKFEVKTPFAIIPALKFGAFLVFILVISKLLYLFIGDSGVYLAGLASGLADVDAITLTLSTLSLGTLASKIAIVGIILAVLSNTIVKTGISFYMGGRNMGKWVAILFAIILAIGLSIAFLV
jgi:uncharacterized membrane protein (DUF4010 family)